MHISWKTVVIGVIGIAVLGGIFIYKGLSDFGRVLEKRGARLQGASSFLIQEQDDKHITAIRDNETISVTITNGLDARAAEDRVARDVMLLTGLFEPQLPPYPEFLGQENACGERYMPVEKKGAFGNFYLLFANERFGFGVCADDLIAYQAGSGSFYCQKQRALYELKYFVPKGDGREKVDALMRSFECR